MKCAKCGNELRKGLRFCTKCGAVVSNTYLEQRNVNNKKTISRWVWLAFSGTVVLIVITCIFVHITFFWGANNIPLIEYPSNFLTTEPWTDTNINYSLNHSSKAI